MWKMKHLMRNADAGEDAGGNGGATDTVVNVLGTGEQSATGDDNWLPEKFRVQGEDGKVDVAQSARKMSESYTHLEKRLGSGDAPPKTADEYAPKVDVEGFDWEEFRKDPGSLEFIKGAHAKGITNDQLGYLLGEYAKSAGSLVAGAAAIDAEQATTSLRETWKSDAEYKENVGLAYRAFASLADANDDINEIGNNPLAIRLLAKIGKEMREDSPPQQGGGIEEAQSNRELMMSEAYRDPKHPEHARVTAQVRKFYEKTYGNAPVN